MMELGNLVDVALVTPFRQMVPVAAAPTFFIKYKTSLKWKVSHWKVSTSHTLSAQKASGKVWNALREFFVQPSQDCHSRWRQVSATPRFQMDADLLLDCESPQPSMLICPFLMIEEKKLKQLV